MKNQQTFSHGLLYSVAPENLATLHLLDEGGHDEFDWLAYEYESGRGSFMFGILNVLKMIFIK